MFQPPLQVCPGPHISSPSAGVPRTPLFQSPLQVCPGPHIFILLCTEAQITPQSLPSIAFTGSSFISIRDSLRHSGEPRTIISLLFLRLCSRNWRVKRSTCPHQAWLVRCSCINIMIYVSPECENLVRISCRCKALCVLADEAHGPGSSHKPLGLILSEPVNQALWLPHFKERNRGVEWSVGTRDHTKNTCRRELCVCVCGGVICMSPLRLALTQ